MGNSQSLRRQRRSRASWIRRIFCGLKKGDSRINLEQYPNQQNSDSSNSLKSEDFNVETDEVVYDRRTRKIRFVAREFVENERERDPTSYVMHGLPERGNEVQVQIPAPDGTNLPYYICTINFKGLGLYTLRQQGRLRHIYLTTSDEPIRAASEHQATEDLDAIRPIPPTFLRRSLRRITSPVPGWVRAPVPRRPATFSGLAHSTPTSSSTQMLGALPFEIPSAPGTPVGFPTSRPLGTPTSQPLGTSTHLPGD